MDKPRSILYGNVMLSLSDALDFGHHEISKHHQRTAYIAWEIARALNISHDIIKDLFVAALLHDVGALSVEEKMDVCCFNLADLESHCISGELLIKTIPQHERIADIVRFHHTECQDRDQTVDKETAQAAQILFLADFIECLIKRGKYILHQQEFIIKKIKELVPASVCSEIVEAFLSFSEREGFWLNLTSPSLYSILNKQGPLKQMVLDIDAVEIVSKFFRDAVDYKTPYTATHTAGVSACAEVLSRLHGFTDYQIQEMKIAANLHDIGKMAIPNSILEKPGRLDKNELALMVSHPYYSHYIISTIAGLEHLAQPAGNHHEKLDGTGYPFHCRGKELSLKSRIMAIADIYAAMTEDRPYRVGRTKEKILGIMGLMAASDAVDKEIVGLFGDHFDEINDYVLQMQKEARDFYEEHLRPYYRGNAPVL